MSIDAMKQALEALEYIENSYMSLPAPAIKAISALRQAIEQAKTADSTCNNFEFYRAAYKQGAVDERRFAANLCEQMGIAGYGTLAIAAAIEQRGNK